MNDSYALAYCKRNGIRYNCIEKKELQEGYYITYQRVSNRLGGTHPVNICLHNDAKGFHRNLTNEHGVFLEFPGVVEGNWRLLYKGKGTLKPWMNFNFSLGAPKSDNALVRLFWEVQPDGRYWMDEDGFGTEDDEEIWLGADIDRERALYHAFSISFGSPLLIIREW